MLRIFLLSVVVAATACTTTVDTAGLPTIDDFESWPSVTVFNDDPGHKNSARVIYLNDVAQTYLGTQYPVGSVIVKDIRDNDGGQVGDRRYLAVMRKLSADADAPTNQDWLFTFFDEPGDDEIQFDYCFDACHKQGPLDHVWLNYQEVP